MKTLPASQNNFFSFSRFLKLFKKHSIENAPTYLISTLVLLGIMTGIMGFASYVSNGFLEPRVQGRIYMSLLIFASPVFTSMIFSDLGDRKRAMTSLILPVSNFEKYTVAWLYSFVIFILVFTLCFYSSAFIILKVSEISSGVSNSLVDIVDNKEAFWRIFISYFAIHAVFFLGAIFFTKQHFIRTAFALFIATIIIALINYLIAKVIFQVDIDSVGPFQSLRVLEGNKGWRIQPGETASVIAYVVMAISVIAVWTCVYFKLKEREV